MEEKMDNRLEKDKVQEKDSAERSAKKMERHVSVQDNVKENESRKTSDKSEKKMSVSLEEFKLDMRRKSHALGLKAASLAAAVSTYKTKLTAMDSLTNIKVNHLTQDVTLSRAARDDLLEIVTEHLKWQTCNLNETDEDGLTALHHAARYNRINCVKVLLDAGAEVDVKGGSDEVTPLHLACRYNSEDVVQLLVASGADLNATDIKGKTPLHYATRRGHNTAAKMLLAVTSCKVDAADNDRTTPLHMAAMQGSTGIVEPLITRGARVGARDINDMTSLMWAAAEGHCDVMKILLKHAVKQTWSERQFVRAQDNEGNSALHFAVMNGKYEATALLLEHYADVNAQKNNMQTPLHIAATHGYLDITELLITCGAHVDMADFDQRTATHKAALFNRVDILKELMHHGADLNSRDTKNMSPLHCACWKGQTEAVEFLLDNGAQIAERDSSLMTVLHWAVQYGQYTTLLVLLKHAGSSLIEATDKNDQTVLHYASRSGNVLVLKTLLEAGAKCDAKDVEERTALHIAAQFDNVQCVEALIEASKHETNDDDVDGRTPLLLASLHGHQQVVQLLLLLGADISSRDDEQRSALMLAAEAGHSATMTILLANHALVNDADKLKNTALHYACAGGFVEAVQMLLQARADVTVKNARNLAPLDMAIDNLHSEVAIVMLKHDSWRQTLSVRDNNGCTAFDRLIARLPDAAMVVLDHCIERSSRDDEDTNLTLTFDYHYVDPGPDDPASKKKRYLALNTMILHGRDSLLSHPVCQNVLSQKWARFGQKLFFVNLAMYIAFMCTLTWYTWSVGASVISAMHDKTRYCPVVFNHTPNVTEYYIQNGVPQEFLKMQDATPNIIAALLSLFIMAFLCREVFKFLQRGWRYLFNPYTWISVILVCSTFGFIYPFGYYPCISQWRAGWLAHFLAWINFIMYLRKIDLIGIYVIMFEAVLLSLLKAILIYFFFCWAFAGSFYIILSRRHSAFARLDEGMINVFVMTLGEIEFVDNFINEETETDPFKRDVYILLAVFIFLMPIVLMNLMIGVAVGDIEKIQRNAYLKRIALQVELLYNIENTMPKFFQRTIYRRRAIVKPNEVIQNKFCSCWQSVKSHVFGSSKSTQFISLEKKDRVAQAIDLLEKELTNQARGMKALQTTVMEQTAILKQISEKLNIAGVSESLSVLNNPDVISCYDNVGLHRTASFKPPPL